VICVTDANIWIDLHNADLLDAAFELEHTWRTPDIIVADEVLTVPRDILVELGLQVRTLSGEELNRIPPLNRRHSRPSPKDLAILVVADVDGGIVVTGDGPLRRAAEDEGLTVHGVLWVLDQLVERGVVTPTRAAAALTAMMNQGSRLPERPVQNRLRRWQSTD
jgi:hypothetical protein